MFFATDLDRTLIYSNRFIKEFNVTNNEINSFIPIERTGEHIISYMSKGAVNKIKEIISKKVEVVPVTLRTVENFKNIDIIKDFKYAITSNGGTILYNGEIHKEWESIVENKLQKYYLIFDDIIRMLEGNPFIIRKPEISDNKFIFSKTDDIIKCEKFLQEELDLNIWNYVIQGGKVYVIPKCIEKSIALKYLSDNILKDSKIIAAGDGVGDIKMLNYATYAIVPEHGNILKKYNYIKDNKKFTIVPGGVLGAENILDKVLENIK